MATDDWNFSLDPNVMQTEANGGWAGGTADWWGSFAKSAVEAVPELVGVTPSEDTQRWRNSNPFSGFASQIPGMVVPYAGWMKAARGIKSLETMAKAAEATRLEKPFTAVAKAEAIRLAPFEIGRVAASQVIGDKPLTEMATEAAINLSIGSALMGGLETFRAAGKVARSGTELLGGINPTTPSQLMLRKVDEMLPDAGDAAPALQDLGFRLDSIVRNETAERYVDSGISGKRNELDRLFRPGISGAVEKRRLTTGDSADTFTRTEDWQNFVAQAGVDPATFSRNVQYPRLISFSKAADEDKLLSLDDITRERVATFESRAINEGWTPEQIANENKALEEALGKAKGQPLPGQKAAARIEKDLTKNLLPAGDGWYYAREGNDGLFVMARKFQGEVGKADPTDKWLLFKTDKPAEFAKKSQQFQNVQVAMERWRLGPNAVERNVGKSGELFSELHDLAHNKMGFARYAELAGPKNGPNTVKSWLGKGLPQGVKESAATKHIGDLIRTYFAPANRQLAKSSRGNWLLNSGRMIQDGVDSYVQKVLQGELRIDPDKSALRQVLVGNLKAEGRSIEQVLDDLDRENLIPEFVGMWRRELTPSAATGVSRRTVELAQELENLTNGVFKTLNTFEDAAGRTPTKMRKGHYGLSRQFEGDHLVALRNESGNVVGMAASHTRRGAEARAKDLANNLSVEYGRPIRPSEYFMRNRPETAPSDLRPFVTNPGFTLERQNIRGFKWDLETPTKQDLLDAYKDNLGRRARNMGSLGRESLLSRDIAALSVEDRTAYGIVTSRFNALSGVEGEFSKFQNRMADKVLAPYLGSNSASKLVQGTNSALMHLQLGFGKLSYPITNIVGTLQTVAPELAFVMNASPETLRGTYHTLVPAYGTSGPVGAMGALNPLKIMSSAMRSMWKPDKALLRGVERGINERVLDPRIVEDYIGENRKALTQWKDNLKSPKGLLNMVLATSEFLPATSERFARQLGFNAAWIAGRDILKITDEDILYRFSKQFTERTMYLYGTADRPLAFTSPLGSSMGLFKNWMMNYTASMVEYLNLGLDKNIWSPLVWQTMGTFAVGGAAATPVYWAAEGASRIFADKSLMNWSYDEFSGGTSDALMYGLPAALTGVSLSSQMTSPGANPMRDAAQLFSFASWDRMKNLGGAVGTAVDNYRATGTHPASDPDVRNQLIKALAPVNIYRTMATQEDGVVRNLGTDLPQIKGMSWVDIQLYRAGLQPLDLEKNLTVANELYNTREKNRAATSRMGDAYAEAMAKGDSRAMEMLIQRSITLGVDVSAMLRSAVTRGKNEGTPVVERLSKPQDLVKYDRILGRE